MEEEVAQNAWSPGHVAGPYRLLAKLATGGMAEIWAARQVGLKGFEKLVVVKKILPSFASQPDFVEMFLDEARIAAQLTHPNIVQIYDLGEIDGAYYIAMEYVAGESLSSVARAVRKAGKRLPVELSLRIISDAAAALDYAHTKTGLDGKPLSIVHRDVSPQNLLITYDGIVKLVDFGVAKATNRSTQTQAGQLKGKLSYMSPEQVRAKKLDGRSDVFALGVVLYEVLTQSKFAPTDASEIQIMELIAGNGPMPRVADKWPEVPEGIERIVARALERDPDKRYQTARAMQVDIEGWLRSRTELGGIGELGAFMRQLFADRIAARSQLLEAMVTEEVSSSRIRGALKPDTGSGTGTPSGRRAAPAPNGEAKAFSGEVVPPPGSAKKSPLPLLIGGAGGLLLAIVAIVLLFGGSEPVAPIPVDKPIEAPMAQLATLVAETEPQGALLVLDGKELGRSPQTVEKLPLGEHTLTATLDGYVAVSRNIQVKTAGERSSVVLVLNKKPAEVVVAADPNVGAVKPLDEVKKKPVIQKGKLSIDTNPWTTVFLDGKKLGDTPLIGVSVPAGKHTVKLVSEDTKQSKVIEVDIQPGKTTVKNLKL